MTRPMQHGDSGHAGDWFWDVQRDLLISARSRARKWIWRVGLCDRRLGRPRFVQVSGGSRTNRSARHTAAMVASLFDTGRLLP